METTNQPSAASAPKTIKHKWFIITALMLGAAVIVTTAVVLINRSEEILFSTADDVQASITHDGITPSTISIKQGQTVVWTNQDGQNHVLAISSDSPPQELNGFGGEDEPIGPESAYSFVFDAQGTFEYHDPAMPDVFKGTIIVE